MKRLLVLVALMFASAAMAQVKHAPLLATCEADVALWYDHEEFTQYLNAQTAFLNDKTPNNTKLNRLSIREVVARHEEMGECFLMTGHDIYREADNSYMGIFHDRETDFILRHHLRPQLMAEDAAGKR